MLPSERERKELKAKHASERREWFSSLDVSVQRAMVWGVCLAVALSCMSLSTCAAIEAYAKYDYLKGH